MKKLLFPIFIIAVINISAQNVGINGTNAIPDASAMLDVSSTNTGLLIPRVTLTGTTDVTTIPSAAISLLVYNTATITDVTPGYYHWDGTTWLRMINSGNTSGGDWALTGNAGTTVGTNFLGTTDAQDLAIYTNNAEAVRVTQNGDVGIGIPVPTEKLHVSGNILNQSNGFTIIKAFTYNNSPIVSPHFIGYRARGTFASPTHPLTDDVLATFQGRNAIVGISSAGFSIFASENHTATANGSYLKLSTTPNGGGGAAERIRVLENGYVGIGTTTPGEQLTIGANNFVFHNGGDKAIGFNTDWTPTGQWTKITGSNYQGRIHFNPATGSLGFISSDSLTNLNNLDDNRIFIQGGTGNVGIGTVAPDPSARMDISDSAKGILIPQVALTGTQDAVTITTPANSLMVYNPGGGGLPVGYYYNKGTTTSPVWVKVTGDCQIWSTNVGGSYNIKTIVDAARTSGVLEPGVYDCTLRTDNPAHWSGRNFKLNAGFYIASPTFPHQIYDVVDITAWTSGCGGPGQGLTSFVASTGAFTLVSGVCVQTITLTCSCQPR